MTNNVLVIGAGFLGCHIINEFAKRKENVKGTSTNISSSNLILDITSIERINEICVNFKPDIIINCAAENDIEKSEQNSHLAYDVNTKGVDNVSKIANKIGCRLIHISTDGIFDGLSQMYDENDLPNPLNHYSKSKYLGEKAIMDNCTNYVIIRTNFFGIDKKSRYLFNSILKKLFQGQKFIGFNDVIFNPLEVSNLAAMIYELSKKNFSGILNLSSNIPISKYEFCIKIANALNFNRELIQKGSIEEIHFNALRPKNTSLDNSKSKLILETPIISLDEWLSSIKNDFFQKHHKEHVI